MTEAVFYRLDTPELGQLLSEGRADEGYLTSLLSDRAALQARLDGLADDYALRVLNKAQMARATATGEAELRRIENEIDRLQRERVALDVPAGQTVRQAWEASESDEWRRSLLALLIKKIVVNPGKATTWCVINGKRYRFDASLIDIHWLC